MDLHQKAIWIFLINVFHSVLVYSGSFTGNQLTQHIKYFESINYNRIDVEHQHSRVARSVGNKYKHVDIKFYSHDRHFHLRLRRDTTVFMQDFALVTSEGEIPYFVNDLYAGEIVDEPGSYCHGSIKNGTLHGRIYSKDEAYTLEPAKLYFDNSDFHSVLYADKHIDNDALMGSGCGVKDEIQRRMQEKLEKANNDQSSNTHEGKSRQRRQTGNLNQQTCPLFIQTDHVFYERFGSREAVVSYIAGHVQAASFIYETADFDSFTDIKFAVSRLRVWTPDDKTNADYKFKSDFIGVEKFLDLASESDWSQYCASYMFTNRDFSNGVLGLAWIASRATNSDGGICSRYKSSSGTTLNTGLVTLNNYGSFVPPSISHLTFAHELGHSFGSFHDPNTLQCTPGGDQGNFLMFAHASSANKPNNGAFSNCSKGEIINVLNSLYAGQSKPWCLVEESSVTSCGNEIVEEGEECDCGYTEDCDDHCCYAQVADHNDPKACKLVDGAICSPSQGPCCNPFLCVYKNNDVCAAEEDCSATARCTGFSANCPHPSARNDKEPCGTQRNLLCKNGTCSESVCSLGDGLEPCQCSNEVATLCHVCCQKPNEPATCVSSYRINIPAGISDPTFLRVGSPCNNYMGYCDVFNECRLANEDGPLSSIIRRIFFSDEPEIIEALEDWLTNNWWVVLIGFICLIIVMVAIVLICDRLVPTSNPFRMEKEKFKKWRRSSQYVKFRGRQDRNTQYGRRQQPPPNVDDHPDSRTESRATSF